MSLTADTLGIIVFRPGASIALDAGSQLEIWNGGRLTSRGAPGRPVTVTAIDPSRPWDLIQFSGAAADTSYLTNTRIEYAGSGSVWAVWINGPHNVVLDSVHIRQIAKGAILIQGPSHSRISRTLVDTAGTTVFGDGGLRINTGNRLEDVVVHGARGDGVILAGDSLQVNGLEVTGSGGDGIVLLTVLTNFTFNRVNAFGNTLSGISNQTVGPLSLPNVWWERRRWSQRTQWRWCGRPDHLRSVGNGCIRNHGPGPPVSRPEYSGVASVRRLRHESREFAHKAGLASDLWVEAKKAP